MVSDNTRSELVARLFIVKDEVQVLAHEYDKLRENLEKLADEEKALDTLIMMYDKDKAWSKN